MDKLMLIVFMLAFMAISSECFYEDEKNENEMLLMLENIIAQTKMLNKSLADKFVRPHVIIRRIGDRLKEMGKTKKASQNRRLKLTNFLRF